MNLVIPSNIPWSSFTGERLEELIFWLLDDMGAKDIEWRRGGIGVTSSDGGRDIEASFYAATPDGEMETQKWWVEVKGRNKTLERDAVQKAIYNVQSCKNIDILIIVTNTQFSNSTRDWVKDWQEINPRPKIRLWDKESLERMVIKHPSVILRVYDEALSDQGRLEATKERFWNQSYFPNKRELDFFWKKRREIKWSIQSILAITAGEIANGDINNRPWLTQFDDDIIADLLILSIVNVLPLYLRAEKFGFDTSILMKNTSYIILYSLVYLSDEIFKHIITNPWEFIDKEERSEILRDYVYEPLVSHLVNELGDVCSQNCSRIISGQSSISEKEIKNYWKRFIKPTKEPEEGAS